MGERVSMKRCAEVLGLHRMTLDAARKRTPPLPTHGRGPNNEVLVDPDEVKAYLEQHALGKQGRRVRSVELAREAQNTPAGPVAASESTPPARASTPARQDPPKLTAAEQKDLDEAFEGFDGVERALRLHPDSLRRLSAVAAARKELADAQKRELEVQKSRGLLVDAATIERGRVQRILIVTQGLAALPGQLAARLVGRTAEEIHAELEAAVDTLRRAFSEEFAKL